MEAGVIDHIEGSMNGPLGDYCTQGKMRGMGVLRSHGGRWQAIQDGEVHIDIAVRQGFRLGQSDARDFGLGEHRGADEAVVNRHRIVVEQRLGDVPAFADRDRGQLRAARDVAPRRRDAGRHGEGHWLAASTTVLV